MLTRTINTEPVKFISAHEILDPVAVGRNNGWVLSIDIWQGNLGVAKPAVLLARDVTPIDCAVRVKLRLE